MHDSGEREGAVVATTPEQDYPEYDPAIHGFVELAYGEQADALANAGSISVNPQTGEVDVVLAPTIDEEVLTGGEPNTGNS